MFLSKFSLNFALLGSVAAVGISSAQAVIGEDSQQEVRKAAPAAPAPLKQDHPLYWQVRYFVPSGDLTVDHADAYQQLENLLAKAPFAPNQIYFQRVLGAREVGIELKNSSEVFLYGYVQDWIGKGESVTKTHFEAARQLDTLLAKAPFAPNQIYFQRVLGAREADIDLKNVSEMFLYGYVQDWIGKGESVTKTHFEAARQLDTLFAKAPFAPNQIYFQRVLGAREAGIDLKDVSEVFLYGEVSDILKSQPTSTQFQAYQNLQRHASYRSVTKAQIEDEVKRMASAQ